MNRKHFLQIHKPSRHTLFLETVYLAISVQLRNWAKITVRFNNLGVSMFFFGHCENRGKSAGNGR